MPPAIATQTLREIALKQPTSIRVFEHLGIDSCCGGDKSLAAACAEAHLDLRAVLTALQFAAERPPLPTPDWSKASLELLCAHIVLKHHAYLRRELPLLIEAANGLLSRHGQAQPELADIHSTLSRLEFDLVEHLSKEETVVFPYIVSLERAVDRALSESEQVPVSCFGFLPKPVAILCNDHETIFHHLSQIRDWSHQYTPPLSSCITSRSFYEGLRNLDADLRRHLHLENNILFPRAVQMETAEEFVTSHSAGDMATEFSID
ncbi:MAG: DUF542 domain-containing protein [Acidobacteriota bacterium]